MNTRIYQLENMNITEMREHIKKDRNAHEVNEMTDNQVKEYIKKEIWYWKSIIHSQ